MTYRGKRQQVLQISTECKFTIVGYGNSRNSKSLLHSLSAPFNSKLSRRIQTDTEAQYSRMHVYFLQTLFYVAEDIILYLSSASRNDKFVY